MSAIASLFEHENLARILPNRPFVEGAIFAVAATPEIPMPEAWMPWLISQDKQNTPPITPEETDVLADHLMNGLREQLSLMRDKKIHLPPTYNWNESALQRVNFESWLMGLLHVHQHVESVWQKAWTLSLKQAPNNEHNEQMELRLTRCLKFFSSLANTELTLKSMPQKHANDFVENIPKLVMQMDKMLQEYVQLADELASYLPNQFETFTQKTS